SSSTTPAAFSTTSYSSIRDGAHAKATASRRWACPERRTTGGLSPRGQENDMTTWIIPGVRTPFARVDGALRQLDAAALSVPVVKAMSGQLAAGDRPDLLVWGTAAPNLGWSNIAREVMAQAQVNLSTPAFSTVLACATSMVAAFEAAGML